MANQSNNVAAPAAASKAKAPRRRVSPSEAKTLGINPGMIANPDQLRLVKARAELTASFFELREKETKVSGSIAAYSTVMDSRFGPDWYILATTPKIDLGANAQAMKDAIMAEQKALYGMLKSRGYSNERVVWGRVRAYAKAQREGVKPKAKADPLSRTKAELGAAMKRLKAGWEGSPKNAAQVVAALNAALALLEGKAKA